MTTAKQSACEIFLRLALRLAHRSYGTKSLNPIAA
jgi:hypothetical protein